MYARRGRDARARQGLDGWEWEQVAASGRPRSPVGARVNGLAFGRPGSPEVLAVHVGARPGIHRSGRQLTPFAGFGGPYAVGQGLLGFA